MRSGDDELNSIRRTAHDWQVRLNNFDISDEERITFEKWRNADPRHEDAFERAAAVSNAIGGLTRHDLDRGLAPSDWRDRLSALWITAAGVFSAKPFQFVAAGAALAAISAIVITPLLNRPSTPAEIAAVVPATFASATGEGREIILEDGTLVALGAKSEIAVAISPNARDVALLSGAAFFNVASDPSRPFTVTAERLTATALGTQFDVRRSGGVTRVAVAEGRVEVVYPMLIEGEPTTLISRRTLAAGTQIAATDSEGLGSVSPVEAVRVGEWRSDRLVYETATLAELVADANRYTNARVEFSAGSEFVSAYKISGAFNGHDIDGMLTTLEAIHPVEIDRSEPGVTRIRAKDR